jgi:hypothetical protein
MAYTDIDKPSDYFNTVLYTGTGSSNAISGVGFSPDFIWGKGRTNADSFFMVDSVRGATKHVRSDSTDSEYTRAQDVKTIDSDGFTVGTDDLVNKNTTTFVSWNWLADTSFSNDASGTGIGSIDSVGSFNNTSGCSIVTYTGTGSNGTVKHGLNTAPYFIAIRSRSNAGSDWHVYHNSLGGTKFLRLNTTAAAETNSAAAWNNTAPTSSVFSLGTGNNVNGSSRTYIAYCFADTGNKFFKAGSYTGNGNADGTFVYTGFKPAFVMFKMTSEAQNWGIYDNKRVGYNEVKNVLFPNLSNAENTDLAPIDLLSNGFKMRRDASASDQNNKSGGTYIYMAFAEAPLVGTNNIPANAR